MSFTMRAAVAAGVFALAGAANAVATPINPDGGGSEPCLVGSTIDAACSDSRTSILTTLRTGGDAGTNTLFGTTFERVNDDFDKVWSTLTSAGGEVQFRARYAGDRSSLGLMPLSAAPFGTADFVSLLGVAPTNGVDLTNGPWAAVSAAYNPFVWVLYNESTRQYLSSDTSVEGFANSGSRSDWMVTFRASNGNYVIAWEDRTNLDSQGRPNDWDYNDFVFELRNVRTNVPEPATLALLGLGLAGLGFAGRRRSK